MTAFDSFDSAPAPAHSRDEALARSAAIRDLHNAVRGVIEDAVIAGLDPDAIHAEIDSLVGISRTHAKIRNLTDVRRGIMNLIENAVIGGLDPDTVNREIRKW